MARQQYVNMIVHAQGDGSLVTYSGVTIDVFFEGTATRPNLFADVTGATPVSNPFNTAASGAIKFAAEEGYKYDIKIHDPSGRVADETIRWRPSRVPAVGDLRMAAQDEGDSADGQWLVADNRAISRATYAEYFGLVGTAWGSGDGSTTFNIPDMRGRAAMGAGQGAGLTNRSVGTKVGAETHQLGTGELPAHNHGVTDPGHRHRFNSADAGVGTGAALARIPTYGTPNAFTDTPGGSWSGGAILENTATGIAIQNAGGGGSHNNVQPSAAVKMLVKVK